MPCASCALSSGVANNSRRRSVVTSVSRAGFQDPRGAQGQPTCSSDGTYVGLHVPSTATGHGAPPRGRTP
eukprot:5732911-Prymnesium_polylepis.1